MLIGAAFEASDAESLSTASLKQHASGDHGGARPPPYFHESKNEWGVPIASISDTNAKPPDQTLGRRGTQLKKVAKSTVTAISVTRRWSRKKGPPSGEDTGKPSKHQRENLDKNEFMLGRERFTEKGLPMLPAN